MSFTSVNELDKFIFDDCNIADIKLSGDSLILTLEALIVGARNSQNTNYTESYADETTMVFRSAHIESMVEEGYKVYDANDNLQEEVPDKPISPLEIATRIMDIKGGYLFAAECISKTADKSTYSFEVDMGVPNEDGIVDPYSTTYQFELSFSEVTVSWERYLNRVQK